jgi:signal transduction histidine kinase
MFKNLRTGTKLFVLCSMFIISVGVTAYGLVAEKQIAIDFARKELAGTRYLTTLRGVYSAILTGRADDTSSTEGVSPDRVLNSLAAAQAAAAGTLQTAELEQTLSATLLDLWSGKADAGDINALVPEALIKAQNLASRIADDSNLALDPDLDSYYVQDIVVAKLPALLGQLGRVQTLMAEGNDAGISQKEREIRFFILDSLVRSTTDGVNHNIAVAYRGNADGSLRPAVDADIAAMVLAANRYLDGLKAALGSAGTAATDSRSLDQLYDHAVGSAMKAWAVSQAGLDRLLQQRIDDLNGRLVRSLLVIGVLGGLSIILAVMTHRYIVQPLRRLESLAKAVRETKDYSLRIEYNSRDEIGRLAAAFTDMLAELATARQREIADQTRAVTMQSELARVARLITMGEMAASIAHEINQPLAAIVTNGNAGLRWLANVTPDLGEARAALKRIVNDGHRASQVIASIRAMLKKGGQEKTPIEVNELIREALTLVHGELQDHGVVVESDLAEELPAVPANRVQLQQVVLNLIGNAIEAMGSVTDRPRIIRVNSAKDGMDRVLVTVEDSGTGIEPGDMDHIFEAFFTTKSNGMGLGLAICRSIVEDHGGRLSASAAHPHGSAFRVVLPAAEPGR